MKRVLLVGYDPKSVDFSDPALPPGMTAEKIYAGVQVALKQMTERGWESDCCYVHPDQTGGPAVERQLAVKTYDCVVIGAGVSREMEVYSTTDSLVVPAHSHTRTVCACSPDQRVRATPH